MDVHELESVPLPPAGGKPILDNNTPMVAVGFLERAPDPSPSPAAAAVSALNSNDAADANSGTGTEVDSDFLLEPDCDSAPEAEATLPPLSASSSFNLTAAFGAIAMPRPDHTSSGNSKSSTGAYQAAYGDDDIDAQIERIEQSSPATVAAAKEPPEGAIPVPGVATYTDQGIEGAAGASIGEPVVKKKKKKGVGFASFALSDAPGPSPPNRELLSAAAADSALKPASSTESPIELHAKSHSNDKPKKKKGVGFTNFSLDTTTGFDGAVDPMARMAATPAATTHTSPRGVWDGGKDPLEDSIELGKAEASPGASRNTSRFFEELMSADTGTGSSTTLSASDAVIFEAADDLKLVAPFDAAEECDKEAGRFSRPSSAGSTRSRGGSAGDKESGNGDNTTDIQDVTYMASAAQFRRIERANRHYSIACDVWCGIEETRNRLKGIATLAATTCCVPLIAAIICYSSWALTDIDSGPNRALHTLSAVLAFSVQGVLLVEAFSSIVCEIEYGVVVSEELPILYAKCIAGTSMCIIIAQQCMYSAYDVYFTGDALGLSNPDHRAWLGLLLAGFLGGIAPIALTFFRHAPAMLNSEMTWVFVFWAVGCCICLLVVPVFYGMFAVLLATSGHKGTGIVGSLLAFVFPHFTPFVKTTTHQYAHWGEGRQRLYDGAVLDVLLDSIHAAALCLLVVDVQFGPVDMVLLLVSQAALYGWRVVNLLSASTSGISICERVVPWMANKRIGIKESPSPTKYRVTGSSEACAGAAPTGISADALESYPFVMQCAKLRDITSLLCSLVLGAAVSLVFTLFTLVVSASHNDVAFAGPGLWVLSRQDVGAAAGDSSMSGTFQRLIILFCFQCLSLLLVLYWMQSNGHVIGVMLYQLEFNLSQMLAAASTYAVVAILGCVLHGNGMNA